MRPKAIGISDGLICRTLELHGGPKNVENLHIFGPPYSHARTRQNTVIQAQFTLNIWIDRQDR